jgi:hypothetical protein
VALDAFHDVLDPTIHVRVGGGVVTQRWEYEVIRAYPGKEKREYTGKWHMNLDGKILSLRDGLDLLGSEGWELVGIQLLEGWTGSLNNWYQLDSFYVFKRQLEG